MKWNKEEKCVVDDINIQRWVYMNGVKLHKVHKQENQYNIYTNKQGVVELLDQGVAALFYQDNNDDFDVDIINSLDNYFE